MIVLADNDVLFKLAQCDLFAEFLAAFELTTTEVMVLPRVRFSILKPKRYSKRVGDDVFDRLKAFLASVSVIHIEPDLMYFTALSLQTDKNIDAGEAALFAICPVIENSSIVTGDKKSLTGLTEAGTTDDVCAKLCSKLAGRVFCFEQVLEKIIDRIGFDVVRGRLVRGRECDRGLTQWLGYDSDATEACFREGLKSYLNEARRTSGRLLAP